MKQEKQPNSEVNMNDNKVACKYMIHLMRCALNGTMADEKPENCSWTLLYNLISNNNIQGLTYYAIEPKTKEMPQTLVKVWRDYRDTVIYKKLMMEEERKAILRDLETKGFSFLLLKGCNIEKYYPMPGMRDMADNDILYGMIEQDEFGKYHIIGRTEEERRNNVREGQGILLDYMKKRGYETSGFYEKDDVCTKDNFYNFEMHRDLMDPDIELHEYYKNPWKNAIKNEENDYEYHFSLNDEYIFYIVHEYKHFSTKGCGVRNLADLYVFLKAEQEKLDWEYITGELDKLKLVEFEAQMRKLAFDSMSKDGKVDIDDEKILLKMCMDGTFGIDKTEMQRRVKEYLKEGESVEKAKRRYYFHRFFPDDSYYIERYPFFYKHILLRPLLTVYRCIRGILFHRKHLKKEMKNVLDTK